MCYAYTMKDFLCVTLLFCTIRVLDALLMYPAVTHHLTQTKFLCMVSKGRSYASLNIGMRVIQGQSNPQLQHNVIKQERPTYPDLTSGVRISRIISVSTHSFDAMLKLARAKSRPEIMHTALIRHKRKCIMRDHQHIPLEFGDVYQGWSHEPRNGSPMRTNAGTRSSELWAVDGESFHHFEVEVGSWLLASMPGKDPNHVSALFSRNISRVQTDAQPVNLVRPGFSTVKLVQTPEDGVQWVLTFLELVNSDELGIPKKQ
jgi:hypothetical protein